MDKKLLFGRNRPHFCSETWLLIKNSTILSFGHLSEMLLTMMSLIFCGHLGSKQFQAVVLANSIITVVAYAPVHGMATACDTLFPQLNGGKDRFKLGIALQKSILILTSTSLICIGLMLNARFVISFVSYDEELIELTYSFLAIYSPSLILYAFFVIISKYLQAQDILMPSFTICWISNVVNALLHALLLYHFKFGICASAVAMFVANGFNLAMLIAYIFISGVYKSSWHCWTRECLSDWWPFLRLGIPGMGLMILEWGYFELAVFISASIGETELSVMSLGMQVLYILSLFNTGISAAGNIRIGNLLGQNKPSKAIKAVRLFFTIGITTTFFLSLLVFAFSSKLPLLFSNDPKILVASQSVMQFMAVSTFADAMAIYGNEILNTVGAQKYKMLFFLVCYYLIGLPLGYFFLFKSGLKALGFFINQVILATTLFVLQIFFILRIDWKKTCQKAHELSMKEKERFDEDYDF